MLVLTLLFAGPLGGIPEARVVVCAIREPDCGWVEDSGVGDEDDDDDDVLARNARLCRPFGDDNSGLLLGNWNVELGACCCCWVCLTKFTDAREFEDDDDDEP